MKKLSFVILLFIALVSLTGCLSALQQEVSENIQSQSDQDARLKKLTVNQQQQQAKTASSSYDVQNSESQAQDKEVQFENLLDYYNQAVIKTNLGDIKVAFYSQDSPFTVNNFLNLAKLDFYDQTKFHRVMADFMIQGGDPLSKDEDWTDDGTGGPGYRFKDEINNHKLVRGSLAMANSGVDTNGSQFFIVTARSVDWLDGKHTNFGYVVEGMEVVDKIEAVKTNDKNHPLEDVIIEDIELLQVD